MPNLYASLAELRAVAPDSIITSVTAYDQLFLRLANTLSRWVDRECQRAFFPVQETRYFEGTGTEQIYIPDLLSLTDISVSDDNGVTYGVLSPSDYFLMAGEDYNPRGSYNRVKLNENGSQVIFPTGQRAIKINGIWAFADDRVAVFEDSLDDVLDNPLLQTATLITVADADGADQFGVIPRFSAGQLIRMGSEYAELTATNTGTNKLTAVRGRNGTSAADQAQNTGIYIWRVPDPVKQAVIIQAIHQFKRGQAGYGDAEAMPDVGKIMHIKAIDPEALALLEGYRRLVYA